MGLTFVAVTLAPRVIAEQTSTVVRGFMTPIVAYFATVLIISLIVLVPHANGLVAASLAVIGLIGLIYVPSTDVYKQWRENELGIDDLLWYALWPFAGYLLTVSGAYGVWRALNWAPYVVAADVVLFLIVGIRNGWDVVITIARQAQNPGQ